VTARRCVLSEASTLLWRMGYAPTAARLICAAQTVADKKRCPVVLVATDGVEVRTFEPRDAAAWQLFVARALAALTAHPDPFVQSGVRYFVEISAIFIAGVTLWFRRPLGVGETLCFALLARVSGDVPACAVGVKG